MTKYKDNETYERDKAVLTQIAERPVLLTFIKNADVVTDLLRQSMWIGNTDTKCDVIRPLPVVKDKNGKSIKNYSIRDWFNKLNEELDEVKMAIIENYAASDAPTYGRNKNSRNKIAEELQDLITVATSMQAAFLGLNEEERNDICNKVNEKNLKRGYFSND